MASSPAGNCANGVAAGWHAAGIGHLFQEMQDRAFLTRMWLLPRCDRHHRPFQYSESAKHFNSLPTAKIVWGKVIASAQYGSQNVRRT